MEHSVRLKDLGALSATDREVALGRLTRAAAAPINGQAVVISTKIAAFENRYEMSSDELVDRLGAEGVAETAEYAEWLFWLKLRELSAGR